MLQEAKLESLNEGCCDSLLRLPRQDVICTRSSLQCSGHIACQPCGPLRCHVSVIDLMPKLMIAAGYGMFVLHTQ